MYSPPILCTFEARDCIEELDHPEKLDSSELDKVHDLKYLHMCS